MVIGISKRHQFRNEKALQDLVRTVPGNDRCADCQAMNPGMLFFFLFIGTPRRGGERKKEKIADFYRMGQLECTYRNRDRKKKDLKLTCTDWCFLMHALRYAASQTGHAYLKSQVVDDGQLGIGSGGCE